MNRFLKSDDHESLKRDQCLSSQQQPQSMGGNANTQRHRPGIYDSLLVTSKSEDDNAVKYSPSLPSSHMVESSRFPCKARNVCESHTADAAYIELPPNPPHGLTLFCSHPKCSETGRAFRWCSVCEIVVAKRNFVMRHGHGLLRSRRSHTSLLENDTPSQYKRMEEVRLEKSTAVSNDESQRCQPWGTNETPSGSESVKSFLARSTIDSQPLIVNFSDPIVGVEKPLASRWHRSGRRYSLTSGLCRGSPPMVESLVGQSQVLFSDDEEMSIETIGSLNGLSEADIDDIFD